jgi:hypothetical protein
VRNLVQDRAGQLRGLARVEQVELAANSFTTESTMFTGPKRQLKAALPCTKGTQTMEELLEDGYQIARFEE